MAVDIQEKSLADICEDLFSLILYLRESRDSETPDEICGRIVSFFEPEASEEIVHDTQYALNMLYDRTVLLLDSLEEKAKKLGIRDSDIQDVKYAIVAFVDGTVAWASRLEQGVFGNNVAGEEFFNRLEKIKEAKGREGVLEVYYLCLALGFEGKYFRNPRKLQEYAEEIREILNLEGAGTLSPRGELAQEPAQKRRSFVSRWLPWVVAVAGVVAVVVIIILLKNHMSNIIDALNFGG